MLRTLVRTPRRRLAWLVLVVALAWAAWAVLPPAPETGWSLPVDEAGNYGFSPDGRTVLTAMQSWKSKPANRPPPWQTGPLVGRDVETGRERYRLLGPEQSVGMVEVSPDGRRATVEADERELIVFDPADGRRIAAVTDCTFGLEGGALVKLLGSNMAPFSPDGRWLAYRTRAGGVRLFDLTTERDGPTLTGAVSPMSFSSDGAVLAAQTADRHLGFWDAATGAARPAAAARGPEVLAGDWCFAPDGRTFAAIMAAPPVVGLSYRTVGLWDVASGARKPGPPLSTSVPSIDSPSFSPDGRFLAVMADPGWLCDLTTDPPSQVSLASAAAPPKWFALPVLTPDGTGALTADGPRQLTLFDLATRQPRQSFRLRHDRVTLGQVTDFSRDGQTLFVRYEIENWLGRLPDPVRLWLTQNGYVSDRRSVLAAFDVATGRSLRTFAFASNPQTTCESFAPDGRSFWTVTPPAPNETNGRVRFERWSVDPPGPPWWLLGLTAAAVGLAVADRARSRWLASVSPLPVGERGRG